MGAQQPAALKLLNGRHAGVDSGGRKVKAPPAFRRVAPEPPSWLTEEAVAEWHRVVPGMQRLDLLKEEDRALLAAYCETWSVFVRAAGEVRAAPELTAGDRQHAAVTVMRNAGRELRAFAAHFGLSPSAEMALGKVAADEPDDNPFGS